MVINIRHFIITIIAIFLSLGIGIFIGAIIDSQQLFIEQHKVLVAQIEEEFDGFKQKYYELGHVLEEYKKDIERKDKFLDIAFQNLCKDNLDYENILVIEMFTEDNYLDINEVLSSIDSKKIKVKFPRGNDDYIENTKIAIQDKSNILGDYNNDIQRDSAEKIYTKIHKKGYNLLPFYLKSINHVAFEGEIYSNIDFVILIDDGYKINNKSYRFVREELIEMIASSNIPILAIEKSDTSISCMPLYKELGISTVDNVDTKVGKIAMIMVLKGKKGHFGEKITADRLIPEYNLNFNID